MRAEKLLRWQNHQLIKNEFAGILPVSTEIGTGQCQE